MPLRERPLPREVIVWPVHQCGGAASTVLERLADGPLEAVVSKEQAIVKRLESERHRPWLSLTNTTGTPARAQRHCSAAMRGAMVIAPGAKASASGNSQVLNMSTSSSAVAPAARSSASGAFEGSEGMC